MLNTEIRELAKQNGVSLWQIAKELNINDGNFSRKLRKEITGAEKANIIQIIEKLKRN